MTREEISGKSGVGAGSQGNLDVDKVFLETSGPYFPDDRDALVQPRREMGEEQVTPTVVLTFTQPDYQALGRLAQVQGSRRQIWGCAWRQVSWEGASFTVVAPALGAPLAAMVLEKLIALGVRRVLALGWCGSLTPQVKIGDLILPTGAFPGDGTSPHYWREPGLIPPQQGLFDFLSERLRDAGIPWHAGPVWSTDAFYRETKGLVRYCQSQGMLGIELELAALLAVGSYRQIAVAGLLVVSDELFDYEWRPARGSEVFRQARKKALPLMLDVAAAAEGQNV